MELPALTSPGHLLWLVVVLPVLFWLAQPPRPRRLMVTAHRTQWLLAQAALRRRPLRFRALRWLLLCAAAVAGTLAATQPKLAVTPGPERLTVLLDSSASMAARGDEGSPFERALAVLRRTLTALPDQIAVEVVQLGSGTLRRWSGAAARALAAPMAPGGEVPAPLGELAATAAVAGTAVWILSDGQGDLEGAGSHARTCFHGARDNAALLAVEMAPEWPGAGLKLRVEVVGFGRAPLTGSLAVRGAVEPTEPVAVELAPGVTATVELPLRRTAEGGELEVELTVAGDALALDDRWRAVLPPLPAPRIAVRADDVGAVFATKAARALAEAVGGTVVDAAAGESAAFLLVEGGVGAIEPGSSAIAFGLAPGPGAAVWPAPVVVDWDRREPLLQGLDLSELVVEHALVAALPPGQPLVLGANPSGGTAPLAVLVRGQGSASVHFAFRLQDSNLGLLPAFPQLLLRACKQAAGAQDPRAVTPRPSLAEADLRAIEAPPDRPLPAFAAGGQDLASWCLCLSLLLLAVRAGLP